MPERRKLSYASLDEMLADVDRLLDGHETVGKWSLGMMCNHIAGGLRLSVEGFPFGLPWIVRRAVGPIAFRHIDRRGRMPTGIKAPAPMVPRPGLDARAEADALREAVALFRSREPIGEHPLFGPFSREKWERIHCIHAAHHFSFAVPTAAKAPAGSTTATVEG